MNANSKPGFSIENILKETSTSLNDSSYFETTSAAMNALTLLKTPTDRHKCFNGSNIIATEPSSLREYEYALKNLSALKPDANVNLIATTPQPSLRFDIVFDPAMLYYQQLYNLQQKNSSVVIPHIQAAAAIAAQTQSSLYCKSAFNSVMDLEGLRNENTATALYYNSAPIYPKLYVSNLNVKRKGGQIRFTTQQTKDLESRFNNSKYLSPEERRLLAFQLKLTDRQIKTWFQNRRAKWRRGLQTWTTASSPAKPTLSTNANTPVDVADKMNNSTIRSRNMIEGEFRHEKTTKDNNIQTENS